MSALRKFLQQHEPEDLLSVKTVLKLLDREGEGDGPENVSTVQAARILGYSPRRWRVWCEAGRIAGAWQDSERGYWRLPLAACRAHLLRLNNRQPGARRGPWKQAERKSA